MKDTKIEWCDSTWNPVTGCRHGCPYCYARGIAERFKPFDLPHLTQKGIYEGLNELNTPIITACKDGKDRVCAYPYGFEPTLHRYRLNEYEKKKGHTIFVCSMADLFGNWIPDKWIEEVFSACEKAPQHRYLFLTKSPKRYVELYAKGELPLTENMWYGVSVTNSIQAEQAEDSIEALPRKVNNFISAEPLLENVAISNGWYFATENKEVKWVIIGAESGNRRDKVTPKKEWVKTIVRSCKDNGISVFMKDSLIPIIGTENMRREFPWDIDSRKNRLTTVYDEK